MPFSQGVALGYHILPTPSGQMQSYRKDFPGPEFNCQFGKLTDRSRIPVPELAEGALRRLRQLRVCGVTLALTENDGRWFQSPEGGK